MIKQVPEPTGQWEKREMVRIAFPLNCVRKMLKMDERRFVEQLSQDLLDEVEIFPESDTMVSLTL